MKPPVNRREFLLSSTALLTATGVPSTAFAADGTGEKEGAPAPHPLHPPEKGPISVAFLLSAGAQVIDYSGPWEVFQQVNNPKTKQDAFKLYTVAETKRPIQVSGGMKVLPDFDFHDAPLPKVLVIPAQQGESAATLNWIRKCAKHADVVMSVCTGALLLAKTGLLDGRPATTIAGAYKMLALTYPKVKVQREVRFVESGNLACSAGLSSGIDLALHVVARYFGVEVADQTASTMEYAGKGWLDPHDTSDIYARIQKYRKPPFCPVCDASANTNIFAHYHGQTYYFCGTWCKSHFLAAPEKFLNAKGP